MTYRVGIRSDDREGIEQALIWELGDPPKVSCEWSNRGDSHVVVIRYTGAHRVDTTPDSEDPTFRGFAVGYGTSPEAAETNATTNDARFATFYDGKGYKILVKENWSIGESGLPAAGGSKADGQSAALRETAASRTQDAMYVGETCKVLVDLDPVACSDAATRAVSKFVKNPHPHLDSVPNRTLIDSALDSVNAALGRTDAASGRRRTRSGREAAGVAAGSSPIEGSGLAGLSFPSAAFAVADFLIERAKAELVQNTFSKIVGDFRTGDLCKLFPNTHNVLMNPDPLTYRALMPTFKVAVREDLRVLPRNISKDLSIYPKSTTTTRESTTTTRDSETATCESMTTTKPPDGIRLLSAVSDAFMRLESGADVFLILSELYGLDEDWTKDGLQHGLQVFSKFAREFRAWHGFREANSTSSVLNSLLADREKATIFFAFLLSDLKITPPEGFLAYVDDHLPDIRDLAAELAALVAVMEASASENLEQVTSARASVAGKIASVFQTAVPLFGNGDEAERWREKIQLAHSLWTAIEGRQYHRIIVLIVNQLATEGDNSGIPVRLLSFAGSVASAEDAEDLREALEAVADPVGSFRSRRVHNAWSLSLVSYVGLGIGREKITGVGREKIAEDKDGSGGYRGAFAPIGIELSWGTGWSPIASIGLLGSLVDLGTLVSYRFEEKDFETEGGAEDTVDDLPDVNLRHVFSPALSLVFGVTKDHPFSFGATWQLAPELRTLKAAEEQVSVVRWSFFAAIDLTLLRF
ncbi:hypothetical protein [Candidatus Palauibacter sp.]|uniref:hypothetical protein n=1 Tax=Candidatus Palauibacter sp. TaxID=3101350 RepID=UPI003B5A0CF9